MKKSIRRYMRRAYIKLERLWYKLVTLKSSPRKIALGFALGVFIAYTPTFGIQTVLVLSLAALLRINPVSATVGVYVSNPLTVFPMYWLCYKVGALILQVEPLGENVNFSQSLLSLSKTGLSVIGVEFVGSLVVGTVTFPLAYGLALWVVVAYRRARLNRRVKRMRERLEQPGDDEDDDASLSPDES